MISLYIGITVSFALSTPVVFTGVYAVDDVGITAAAAGVFCRRRRVQQYTIKAIIPPTMARPPTPAPTPIPIFAPLLRPEELFWLLLLLPVSMLLPEPEEFPSLLPEEELLLDELVLVVPVAAPVAVGVYVIVTVVAWPPETDMVFVRVMGVAVAVPVDVAVAVPVAFVVVALAVAVNDDK